MVTFSEALANCMHTIVALNADIKSEKQQHHAVLLMSRAMSVAHWERARLRLQHEAQLSRDTSVHVVDESYVKASQIAKEAPNVTAQAENELSWHG